MWLWYSAYVRLEICIKKYLISVDVHFKTTEFGMKSVPIKFGFGVKPFSGPAEIVFWF